MIKNAPLAASLNRPESFQLKGGLFPMTLLELRSVTMEDIKNELEQKVSQSPEFFKQSPIVFGFDQLDEAEQNLIDLSALIELCKSLNLIPAATRGGNATVRSLSWELGMAHIPKGRVKAVETKSLEPLESSKEKQTENTQHKRNSVEQGSAQATEPNNVAITDKAPTKIISHPIRSGQQIYAQGGDLIILSSVSAGAEVLADGNIHIYGALRGRALAGVQGDEQARVFCSSQEAELVSIAGHFLVDETLRETHWRESVQIFLDQGILTIKALS